MFDDVGGKIKRLAQAICWIGIITSVILGLALMAISEEFALIGIIVMALGSLFSWLGSIMIYGFGQLIHNTDILVADKSPIPHSNINSNNNNNIIINDKIDQLNALKDKELITLEEYNQKMNEIKGV